jgi:superfamily I DNA and/or RNA helicase
MLLGRDPNKAIAALGFSSAPLIGAERRVADLEREARRQVDRLKLAEAALDDARRVAASIADDPVVLTDEITKASEATLTDLIDSLETLTTEERSTLVSIVGQMRLEKDMRRSALPNEAAETVLRHLPVWAVTTLSAGSRLPLTAGLFDYVIFDEASQGDIGSAIPLLFRAKTAIFVGDPNQLSMIAKIPPAEERSLLSRQNLYRSGIGRYAQGVTDLFAFATSSSAACRFTLRDHFRCHPEIADYINDAFYGRQLNTLTNVSRLKVPKGFDAGLHWTNIIGKIVSQTGQSAHCEAEAEAIAAHLHSLLEVGHFDGTVGVVSFFARQAERINELIRRTGISQATMDRRS